MKTVLFYFSATGNSLKVARDLADELGEVKVLPMTKAMILPLDEKYEALGIVYPVYMFGLPLIVAEFLRKFIFEPRSYIFSVATLGGLPGRAHTLAQGILKNRDLELSAGFSVLMPGNYTPLYGAIPQERQQKMFREEKQRVRDIAGFIKERKRGIIEEKPFLINFLLYKLLYQAGSRRIPRADEGFWVKDTCTKCGICEKICPVENIKMVKGKPQWLHYCQHCMACLQWCPVEAIQYKKSTQGKKRYHHPDIIAEDIMGQ
ncbi:MAG: EFR1 family ferrodoxin [Candidatus Omnitrophica bacterium]|nr:EFR1 family ferrodoxin [Candidatus Omnitrophota bacterium]